MSLSSSAHDMRKGTVHFQQPGIFLGAKLWTLTLAWPEDSNLSKKVLNTKAQQNVYVAS